MPQTINEQLLDLAVSHQIGLQRLSTKTLRSVLVLLADLEEDVSARILRAGTEIHQTRLESMLKGIRDLHSEAYAEVSSRLAIDAKSLAVYEAEFQSSLISKTLPVEVSFNVPSVTQLVAAATKRPFQGHLLKDWSKQLGANALRRVQAAVRQGAAEGQTTSEVVKRIRGTRALRYKDGVVAMSRRGAESLVRTAMNHVATAAREATYEENSDLIGSVRWVSTLDNRTTPVCRANDGKVFKVGEGPRPPIHWGCRSTTVPVIKSWKDLGIDIDEAPSGTRASMNGQVPVSETYQSWLQRQPVAMQDDILGATRGRLFRAGGVTVERFVDATGRQYTIPELRARDAAAFRAAGLNV